MPASQWSSISQFSLCAHGRQDARAAQRQPRADWKPIARDLDSLTISWSKPAGDGHRKGLLRQADRPAHRTAARYVQGGRGLERVRTLYRRVSTWESWVKLLDAARRARSVQIFISAPERIVLRGRLFGCGGPYATANTGNRGAVGVIGSPVSIYAGGFITRGRLIRPQVVSRLMSLEP